MAVLLQMLLIETVIRDSPRYGRGFIPTKLTIITATQIATPSDQPVFSLSDLTAAPMTVDTWKANALSAVLSPLNCQAGDVQDMK